MKKIKRALALLFTLCMLLSMIPMQAFAVRVGENAGALNVYEEKLMSDLADVRVKDKFGAKYRIKDKYLEVIEHVLKGTETETDLGAMTPELRMVYNLKMKDKAYLNESQCEKILAEIPANADGANQKWFSRVYDIAKASVKIGKVYYNYGEEVKVSDINVSLKIDGFAVPLTRGKDYDVSIIRESELNPYNAKKYVYVKITGKKDYSGIVTKKVKINALSLKDYWAAEQVSVAVTDHTNGQIVYRKGGYKPGSVYEDEVVVKVGNHTLKKGIDYTISYSNYNSISGLKDKYGRPAKEPTLTIKGKGNYTGSFKAVYRVEPQILINNNENGLATIVISNKPMTNPSKVPAITVVDKASGKKLTNKKDYIIKTLVPLQDKDGYYVLISAGTSGLYYDTADIKYYLQ